MHKNKVFSPHFLALLSSFSYLRTQKVIFMKKILTILCFLAASISCHAENKDTITSDFDWEPLMECIIHMESKGNAKARNGQYVGILQISPGMVRTCNNILAKQGNSIRFTLNDRYNVKKSKEMFIVFQSGFNPKNSIEYAIRSWKGGARYSKKATQSYYNRVMKLYNAKKNK